MASAVDERADPATAALAVIREWQWLRCDPDGMPFHPGKELSFVVNRLAMEGVVRPDAAVLTLLSRGELIAHGSYSWRKYQYGKFYQLEGVNEILKPWRWQGLADLIEEEKRELAGQGWPLFEVDLDKLNMRDCPVYEWQFDDNRFCTAVCPPDTETHAPTYVEEWYSAWDIEVWPRDWDAAEEDYQPEQETVAQSANKGGRPPAADWEAAALEIAGRYYRGDFKPQTIADVGRELGSWLGDQDLYPSDSIIRVHAKRIFEAFQAWEVE